LDSDEPVGDCSVQ